MGYTVEAFVGDQYKTFYNNVFTSGLYGGLPDDYSKTVDFVIMNYIPNQKDKDILSQHYGLCGKEPCALAKIAEDHNCTTTNLHRREKRVFREIKLNADVMLLLTLGYSHCKEVAGLERLITDVVPMVYHGGTKYSDKAVRTKLHDKYYAKTTNEESRRTRRIYTQEEDDLIADSSLSDTEIATKINRSVSAVQSRRSNLRKAGIECPYKNTTEKW